MYLVFQNGEGRKDGGGGEGGGGEEGREKNFSKKSCVGSDNFNFKEVVLWAGLIF